MTKDERLEREAQKYAERLASTYPPSLDHCRRGSCNSYGAGENLALAWGHTSVEINATKAWYNEIWDFNYCHGEKNFNRPGHEGKKIGHFTQVIWKTSTKLGIGYARNADRTRVYVVGRYLDHGNVLGRYAENVPFANYLLRSFQNNCKGQNGGLSPWSAPGECTRSCGGGVRFKTRTCTNPKPSLNGRDCDGETQELAAKEWCNIQSCSNNENHRDQQCEARGKTADSYTLPNSQCTLYCHSGTGNAYLSLGDVDDGTHCNSDSGVCVYGKCISMPPYVAPTQPAPTGVIDGSYTEIPSDNVWDNKIFIVPNGAINVTITNHDYNGVEMLVGYQTTTSAGCNWGERSWMNDWVDYYGSFTAQHKTAGVTYNYERLPKDSTITISGPVKPTEGYSLVIYVEGKKRAKISWKYELTG
ncbi:A disintegrin and metalloproteinase with thrombospondin motifs 3-like [Xenia sp. Carnegie-2017]|uniref:A disintegrin and metalloproteinase with thrombospondin motifs 3-like n=1 Tax=Xenia sp. Carnegie-2017 TaxID=2897299 RepID=UPI001F038A72|nr:A disintegrin and metalloproteinase with thrombospondin motifs 3-like [Xenia sp. Carnegie-2017]